MATVSVRIPDEMKERMDEYDEINWSAVLRRQIEAELADLARRNLAHAVATSERLSQDIDADRVADTNTAELIRDVRDSRYGADASR